MKYSIFYISEDGLLKRFKDKWDKYDMLFLTEYESQEAAVKAIATAIADGRFEDKFYQVEVVIIPTLLVRI